MRSSGFYLVTLKDEEDVYVFSVSLTNMDVGEHREEHIMFCGTDEKSSKLLSIAMNKITIFERIRRKEGQWVPAKLIPEKEPNAQDQQTKIQGCEKETSQEEKADYCI